jgi:PilZ domain
MPSTSQLLNGHAATEARYAERRRHKRKPVLWSARVESYAGPADCIILDLSLGGAKIKTSATPVPAHQKVTLVIDRFGALRAEVVWSRMGHMGLRFTDSPDHIAHVVGTTLPL